MEKVLDSAAPEKTTPGPITLQRIVAMALIVATALLAVRGTLDPDMWWHIRTGEWILENGIPHTDVFSYTVPGNEWVTHEWVSQLVIYGIYSIAGLKGLMLAFAAVVLFLCLLVARTFQAGPLLKAVLIMLMARTALVAFGARPQLFSLVMVAAFVLVIEGVRRQGRPAGTLWLLLPLGVLWVNLHSGYLVGVVLVLVYLIGDAAESRWGSSSNALAPRQLKSLGLVTIAVFLAGALNPNGVRMWSYPFDTLNARSSEFIAEWQSPDLQDPTYWPFLLLAGLGVLAFIYTPTKPQITELLLFGGTAFAGLYSLRHIAIFAVVATPIVGRHLIGALGPTRFGAVATGEKDRELAVPLVGVALMGVLLFAGFSAVNTRLSKNDEHVVASYPVAAVDFLESEGLSEVRGFNNYGWGGYLIFRGHEVFIDGRADVYEDEFSERYLGVASGRTWEQEFTRLGVEWALIPPDDRLTPILDAHPAWELIYDDGHALVYGPT